MSRIEITIETVVWHGALPMDEASLRQALEQAVTQRLSEMGWPAAWSPGAPIRRPEVQTTLPDATPAGAIQAIAAAITGPAASPGTQP